MKNKKKNICSFNKAYDNFSYALFRFIDSNITNITKISSTANLGVSITKNDDNICTIEFGTNVGMLFTKIDLTIKGNNIIDKLFVKSPYIYNSHLNLFINNYFKYGRVSSNDPNMSLEKCLEIIKSIRYSLCENEYYLNKSKKFSDFIPNNYELAYNNKNKLEIVNNIDFKKVFEKFVENSILISVPNLAENGIDPTNIYYNVIDSKSSPFEKKIVSECLQKESIIN